MYTGSFCFRKPRRSSAVSEKIPLGDRIGHQPLLSGSFLLSQNDRLSNAWMLAEALPRFPPARYGILES